MKLKIFLFASCLLLALTACSSAAAGAPEALPTIALEGEGGSPGAALKGRVTASGVVAPAQEARMAFAQGGIVAAVEVQVGDRVQAGALLVELDNTALKLELVQAERALREMTSPAAQAVAAQGLADARKALEDAEKKAATLGNKRASDTLLDNTQAEIDLAKQALARASDAYRQVQRRPDGDPKKAAALLAMTNAQMELNALVARYNYLTGAPTDTDAALIQARLESAQADFQEADWYLAALKGETLPAEATGAHLAALQSARDALIAIQQRLDATRLLAPIDGTVAKIDLTVGEYAVPAQLLVIISDIDHLQVETTDLSERNVTQVSLGQRVTVQVQALNETINGRVLLIAPISSTLGGDVVYKTTIQLDRPLPQGLRAGMTVEVSFGE